MRKLKWACGHAQLLYKSGALAITEVGVTKHFAQKDKTIRTTAAITDDADRLLGHVEYTAWYSPRVNGVVVLTGLRGCSAEMIFTWPDLKLVQLKQTRCNCHEVIGGPRL